MSRILAIARKDVRLLLRDRGGLFFTFFFPVIYAVFFGFIFSGASGSKRSAIEIALVLEDASPEAQGFAEEVEKSRDLAVLRASRAEAERLVRTGKRAALVAIPAGYGERSGRIFHGDPAAIEIGVDPARGAEGGMLQGILTQIAFERMGARMGDREAMRRSVAEARASAPELGPFFDSLDAMFEKMPRAGAEGAARDGGFRGFRPVRFETRELAAAREGPKNPFSVTFPQGIVWGIMGCAAGFGVSLVTESRRGTMTRLLMAPLSRRDLLLGKATACFATTLAVQAFMLVVAVALFGVRPVRPALLPVAMVASSVCFVGIMMLLAVVGRTEAAASGIGWAILTTLAMIGGGMIPLFVMPSWLRTLASASPVKWSILAAEGALWRGFGAAEMLLPVGILCAVGAACFLLGAAIFHRRH